MLILALDPGPHTGWATASFSESKKTMTLQDFGTIPNYNQAMKFLIEKQGGIDLVVAEDYVISPKVYGHSHQGDRALTIRLLGAVEFLCLQNGIELVLQMPTAKPAGYGFLGKKYQRGKANMHQWDSLAHLVYYLVTRKDMLPLS